MLNIVFCHPCVNLNCGNLGIGNIEKVRRIGGTGAVPKTGTGGHHIRTM